MLVSPGALLRRPTARVIDPGRHLRGFGGLHGGLTLALLATAMRRQAPPGSQLRTATTRLHHPLTTSFEIETAVERTGPTAALAAHARQDGVIHATATGVFGATRPAFAPAFSPSPPAAPPISDCERFVVPPDFVPISAFMEIRPVGPNRPYAGGHQPELTAWIRLLEDDEPPDAHRLMLLMDALAPSYAAVLTDLRLIPTVELSVRPSPALEEANSPWILLHAASRWASDDGWLQEDIDAWTPDGVHLGSATQLRLVRRR